MASQTAIEIPAGRPAQGPGHYLRDIVYGASDGVITTMAVIAGATGAAFDPKVGLILGLANLAADGFSMGASNYLGLKSELEQMGASVENEKPARHGLATCLAFVLFGAIPLLSYLPIGLPIGVSGRGQFFVALALAALTIILVGASRSRFLPRSAWRCALEMLFVTGSATLVAYLLGVLIAPLVS
jgi:VIT1/CCC1 family predicted Fe2+/Mn2+ transporter